MCDHVCTFLLLVEANYCKTMFACLHFSTRFEYLKLNWGLYFKFQIYGIPNFKLFQCSKFVTWDAEREQKVPQQNEHCIMDKILKSC